MEDEETGCLDAAPIRGPVDDAYGICSAGGGDCEPGPTMFGFDVHGAGIAFVHQDTRE